MKVLHFIDQFTLPTQTFIKRYVQKSMQFADIAIAAFDFFEVPEDIKTGATLFKIDNPVFSRKNFPGLMRYLREELTGEVYWYKQFNRFLEEFKPDVIHCHFGTTGIMMMEFAEKYHVDIPFVTTIYAYDVTALPAGNEKYRKHLDRLWQKGHAFFAEGPSLAEKFVAAGCPPDKYIINPLLVPVNGYERKTEFRQPGAPIKFLFVGRFIEKKGLHIFLEAIGKIKDKIGEFTIDIYGAGPMEQEYHAIATAQGLDPYITWHGIINHENMLRMLKDYDFLVHSSLTARNKDSEGGSATIIIEAQAVGLPIITTDHDDIPYVMGYHDFLAKENDIDSLIGVTKAMINSDNMVYYAELGHQKVLQSHDIDTNTSYEANLRKLAASK